MGACAIAGRLAAAGPGRRGDRAGALPLPRRRPLRASDAGGREPHEPALREPVSVARPRPVPSAAAAAPRLPPRASVQAEMAPRWARTRGRARSAAPRGTPCSPRRRTCSPSVVPGGHSTLPTTARRPCRPMCRRPGIPGARRAARGRCEAAPRRAGPPPRSLSRARSLRVARAVEPLEARRHAVAPPAPKRLAAASSWRASPATIAKPPR